MDRERVLLAHGAAGAVSRADAGFAAGPPPPAYVDPGNPEWARRRKKPKVLVKWLSAASGHWIPPGQRCCGGESGVEGLCRVLEAGESPAAARALGPVFCPGHCIQPAAGFSKVGLAHRVGQLWTSLSWFCLSVETKLQVLNFKLEQREKYQAFVSLMLKSESGWFYPSLTSYAHESELGWNFQGKTCSLSCQ